MLNNVSAMRYKSLIWNRSSYYGIWTNVHRRALKNCLSSKVKLQKIVALWVLCQSINNIIWLYLTGFDRIGDKRVHFIRFYTIQINLYYKSLTVIH